MFDFYDFFGASDLFPSAVVYREVVRCPLCGESFTDFKRTGKLGCSECYNTFKAPLNEVLRQIHRNPIHQGKIPRNMSAELSIKKRLSELKLSLQDAVKNENYEEAAKLHKEIIEIEKGMGR